MEELWNHIFTIRSVFALGIIIFSAILFYFLGIQSARLTHINLSIELHKEISRLTQENTNLSDRFKQFSEERSEHMELAKASIIEAGQSLSNKLLEDHKREANAAKEEVEKKFLKTSESLQKEFERIFTNLGTLHNNVKDMEIVRQALLTPSGAGQIGEIVLENILKNSGLSEGRDFLIQPSYTLENGRILRPDAIVHLPSNYVLVIDSKSSRHFIDIAEEEKNSENKGVMRDKLIYSMKTHLTGLVSKGYAEAVRQSLKIQGARVLMLMFLPTDTALEKLSAISPDFMEIAWKENIIPVGPSGLVSQIHLSKMMISEHRQRENFEEIKEAITKMLSNIGTIQGAASAIGKNLKVSMENYDKLAGSFNRNFINSVRKLSTYGVGMPKQIPQMERYSFIKNDIDGVAEETSEKLMLKEES